MALLLDRNYLPRKNYTDVLSSTFG